MDCTKKMNKKIKVSHENKIIEELNYEKLVVAEVKQKMQKLSKMQKNKHMPWITALTLFTELDKEKMVAAVNILEVIKSYLKLLFKKSQIQPAVICNNTWKVLNSFWESLQTSMDETDIMRARSKLIRNILANLIDLNFSQREMPLDSDTHFDVQQSLSCISGHYPDADLDVLLHCKTLVLPEFRNFSMYIPVVRKVLKDRAREGCLNISTFLKLILLGKIILLMAKINKKFKALLLEFQHMLKIPSDFQLWAEQNEVNWVPTKHLTVKAVMKNVHIHSVFQLLFPSKGSCMLSASCKSQCNIQQDRLFSEGRDLFPVATETALDMNANAKQAIRKNQESHFIAENQHHFEPSELFSLKVNSGNMTNKPCIERTIKKKTKEHTKGKQDGKVMKNNDSLLNEERDLFPVDAATTVALNVKVKHAVRKIQDSKCVTENQCSVEPLDLFPLEINSNNMTGKTIVEKAAKKKTAEPCKGKYNDKVSIVKSGSATGHGLFEINNTEEMKCNLNVSKKRTKKDGKLKVVQADPGNATLSIRSRSDNLVSDTAELFNEKSTVVKAKLNKRDKKKGSIKIRKLLTSISEESGEHDHNIGDSLSEIKEKCQKLSSEKECKILKTSSEEKSQLKKVKQKYNVSGSGKMKPLNAPDLEKSLYPCERDSDGVERRNNSSGVVDSETLSSSFKLKKVKKGGVKIGTNVANNKGLPRLTNISTNNKLKMRKSTDSSLNLLDGCNNRLCEGKSSIKGSNESVYGDKELQGNNEQNIKVSAVIHGKKKADDSIEYIEKKSSQTRKERKRKRKLVEEDTDKLMSAERGMEGKSNITRNERKLKRKALERDEESVMSEDKIKEEPLVRVRKSRKRRRIITEVPVGEAVKGNIDVSDKTHVTRDCMSVSREEFSAKMQNMESKTPVVASKEFWNVLTQETITRKKKRKRRRKRYDLSIGNEICGTNDLASEKLNTLSVVQSDESDIEILAELRSGSESNEESEIDEASGSESDIVPCDETKSMFTKEETSMFEKKFREERRKIKELRKKETLERESGVNIHHSSSEILKMGRCKNKSLGHIISAQDSIAHDRTGNYANSSENGDSLKIQKETVSDDICMSLYRSSRVSSEDQEMRAPEPVVSLDEADDEEDEEDLQIIFNNIAKDKGGKVPCKKIKQENPCDSVTVPYVPAPKKNITFRTEEEGVSIMLNNLYQQPVTKCSNAGEPDDLKIVFDESDSVINDEQNSFRDRSVLLQIQKDSILEENQTCLDVGQQHTAALPDGDPTGSVDSQSCAGYSEEKPQKHTSVEDEWPYHEDSSNHTAVSVTPHTTETSTFEVKQQAQVSEFVACEETSISVNTCDSATIEGNMSIIPKKDLQQTLQQKECNCICTTEKSAEPEQTVKEFKSLSEEADALISDEVTFEQDEDKILAPQKQSSAELHKPGKKIFSPVKSIFVTATSTELEPSETKSLSSHDISVSDNSVLLEKPGKKSMSPQKENDTSAGLEQCTREILSPKEVSDTFEGFAEAEKKTPSLQKLSDTLSGLEMPEERTLSCQKESDASLELEIPEKKILSPRKVRDTLSGLETPKKKILSPHKESDTSTGCKQLGKKILTPQKESGVVPELDQPRENIQSPQTDAEPSVNSSAAELEQVSGDSLSQQKEVSTSLCDKARECNLSGENTLSLFKNICNFVTDESTKDEQNGQNQSLCSGIINTVSTKHDSYSEMMDVNIDDSISSTSEGADDAYEGGSSDASDDFVTRKLQQQVKCKQRRSLTEPQSHSASQKWKRRSKSELHKKAGNKHLRSPVSDNSLELNNIFVQKSDSSQEQSQSLSPDEESAPLCLELEEDTDKRRDCSIGKVKIPNRLELSEIGEKYEESSENVGDAGSSNNIMPLDNHSLEADECAQLRCGTANLVSKSSVSEIKDKIRVQCEPSVASSKLKCVESSFTKSVENLDNYSNSSELDVELHNKSPVKDDSGDIAFSKDCPESPVVKKRKRSSSMKSNRDKSELEESKHNSKMTLEKILPSGDATETRLMEVLCHTADDGNCILDIPLPKVGDNKENIEDNEQEGEELEVLSSSSSELELTGAGSSDHTTSTTPKGKTQHFSSPSSKEKYGSPKLTRMNFITVRKGRRSLEERKSPGKRNLFDSTSPHFHSPQKLDSSALLRSEFIISPVVSDEENEIGKETNSEVKLIENFTLEDQLDPWIRSKSPEKITQEEQTDITDKYEDTETIRKSPLNETTSPYPRVNRTGSQWRSNGKSHLKVAVSVPQKNVIMLANTTSAQKSQNVVHPVDNTHQLSKSPSKLKSPTRVKKAKTDLKRSPLVILSLISQHSDEQKSSKLSETIIVSSDSFASSISDSNTKSPSVLSDIVSATDKVDESEDSDRLNATIKRVTRATTMKLRQLGTESEGTENILNSPRRTRRSSISSLSAEERDLSSMIGSPIQPRTRRYSTNTSAPVTPVRRSRRYSSSSTPLTPLRRSSRISGIPEISEDN